ncbi:unnamed protein product [Zymoseptoria tritici ST99CH_1E4]|uniref:Uncharacterized protein n=1 Tax=Zymoseptoria tritici ST99CH_1E4 TaxID=1276532 RepID=A0A2H1GTK5_ZYMTR|nr:unnamed protein product [Zymoseptoria tritici ST99CH_1E4]
MANTDYTQTVRKDGDLYYSTAGQQDSSFHFGFDEPKSPTATSATIKNISSEPIFWHGYASEEEMASPVEVDDVSVSDDDFDLDDISVISSRRSSSASIVSAISSTGSSCIQAQAVTMAIVRPKMVQVPKMSEEHPAKRRLVHSVAGVSSDKIAVSHLRSASMETPRRDDSIDSYSLSSLDWAKAYAPSPPSTTGSSSSYDSACDSFHEQPVPVKRNTTTKHVPLMEAARNLAPLTEAVAEAVSPMPYGHHRRSNSSTSPSLMSKKPSIMSIADQYKAAEEPSVRRTKTFGANFSISNIGKNLLKRGESIQQVERQYNDHTITRSQTVLPQSTPHPIPSRTSSMAPAKRLVARGGSERAAAIILPDCPDKVQANHWPLRNSIAESTSYNPRPHKLQRPDAARITSYYDRDDDYDHDDAITGTERMALLLLWVSQTAFKDGKHDTTDDDRRKWSLNARPPPSERRVAMELVGEMECN